MPFTLVQRRCFAWLAMLAMLLGALNPAIARTVVAASGSADWVEVCSSTGIMKVLLADDEQPAGHLADDAPMVCVLCSHHGAADLPPVHSPVLHGTFQATAPPIGLTQAPTSTVGLAPAPRGPPSL